MATMIPVAVSLLGAPVNPVQAVAASVNASMAGGQNPAIANNTIVSNVMQPAGAVSGVDGVTRSASAPFASLLTEAVGQAERFEGEARSAIEGLMSGKGVDVHEAMIATEKAEMGFELVLSVRNKALAAYQQVMGMQF